MNIEQDLKNAMKSKDVAKLPTLRALKAALEAAATKGKTRVELSDLEKVAVIRALVKQREDSIEAFQKAGYPHRAEDERAEKELLETYLPAPLSDEDLNNLIDKAIQEVQAVSKKEMGKAIKRAVELAEGRVASNIISQKIQNKLQ